MRRAGVSAIGWGVVGVLLGFLPSGCSGDDGLELVMVDGPVRGAPLDGPPGAIPAPADSEALAAPLLRALREDPGDESLPLDSGLPPVTPAGAGPAENPAHGVKAVRPADLPADLRYLTFEDLSWPEYEPPELRGLDEEELPLAAFPEGIRALQGVRAAFDGYMVPVDFADRKVTSFILSRYLAGCCFGAMPRMDEWVEVAVEVPGGVDYVPFQVVRVVGTFEVGEVLDDYGYVRSIYRMRAQAVEAEL